MKVELTPEIVRIAQMRADKLGLNLSDELARIAFEEAVMSLDPELDFLVNPDEDTVPSLNAIDVMAVATGVNDVIVNEHRVDVRAINDLGQVIVPRAILNSPVLNNGTFVVQLNGTESAEIRGYLSVGKLISSTNYTEDYAYAIVEAECPAPGKFDLVAQLNEIRRRIQIPLDKAVNVLPNVDELKLFLWSPNEVTKPRQKQILTAICAHVEIRRFLEIFEVESSRGNVSNILRSASRWNKKTDDMARELDPRFKSLSQERIKKDPDRNRRKSRWSDRSTGFQKRSPQEIDHRRAFGKPWQRQTCQDEICYRRSPQRRKPGGRGQSTGQEQLRRRRSGRHQTEQRRCGSFRVGISRRDRQSLPATGCSAGLCNPQL